MQELLDEQAYRSTAAEEAALHSGLGLHASNLLDPGRHSVALDAFIKSITEPPIPQRNRK